MSKIIKPNGAADDKPIVDTSQTMHDIGGVMVPVYNHPGMADRIEVHPPGRLSPLEAGLPVSRTQLGQEIFAVMKNLGDIITQKDAKIQALLREAVSLKNSVKDAVSLCKTALDIQETTARQITGLQAQIDDLRERLKDTAKTANAASSG